MCNMSHTYTVEVIGQKARYVGNDEDEAISALLGINPDYDEEGYVVAEHGDGIAGTTVYCPAESNRIENEAIKAQAHMETQCQNAYEAFHGDGPYALANQDW